MAKLTVLISVIIILPISSSLDCKIPSVIRGSWYSYENGRGIETIIDEQSVTGKGNCLDVKEEKQVNYTFVFKQETENCYRCVKILIRTINVVEKIESSCVTLPLAEEASVENVCKDNVLAETQLTTLFEENYAPVNCRTSLAGAWQLSYLNGFRFTNNCNQSESFISSCPSAISQFLVANKKINFTYKKCVGINGTFDDVTEYACLGDWFVGRNHFFAVANAKEARKDKKYRCFLKKNADDSYIGASVTPECSTLKTVNESPVKLHLTPLNSELVVPSCTLPQNFSGDWIDASNLNADIFINTTHIVETLSTDEGRLQQIAYVCHQMQGTRYLMARHTFDGCQNTFVCFEFVKTQQNIIRYKRSIVSITGDFDTVCSWEQYKNRKVNKLYDLYLAKEPVPGLCPFTGKFNFTQQGDILFEKQMYGGITLPPRPGLYCRQNISEFSVCEGDHNNIDIELSHCLAEDYRGRPVQIYSDKDYKLQCIGFWKENDKSYLLTYNKYDAISKYYCWVYQRVDIDRILMSQSIGPFCDLNQRVTSSNYTEGAAVALELQEYEAYEQCPLHFVDGSNPWMNSENIKMSNIRPTTVV